jgi:uncharacterized Zn-binding protein involved in type VI secretion
MPGASRLGDTLTTGHACSATSTVATGSSSVFINSISAARQGDIVAPHTILVGIYCVPHSAVVNAGSSSVFINGIPAARIGDSADMGALIQGSSDVYIG